MQPLLKFSNTSSLSNLTQDAQKQRVLEHLQHNPAIGLNRFEADKLLNVCHLAARIKALRNEGYSIISVAEIAHDLNGRPHKGIARYFWQACQQHQMAKAA
ncbi:helix-turn-helix domain-containing protein [Alkanindiges illinoisensis]|uniref:helix-turn-helix domain-containing protein n=1 Tax=Alkanindiges illinoisensis TaxID=197183 RepID=UPI00047B9DD5|nr:helix-turn-helix domain-containing protein [Alkanindiges illinoisensis]